MNDDPSAGRYVGSWDSRADVRYVRSGGMAALAPHAGPGDTIDVPDPMGRISDRYYVLLRTRSGGALVTQSLVEK